MKKIIFYLEFGIIGIIVWCILYEQFSLDAIVVGFIIGVLSSLFANSFLMTRQSKRAYYINPLIMAWFLINVLYQIMKSAIVNFIPIILGKANMVTVRIRTKVDSGLMTSVIGNAITMIPGTVTLDKKENVLTVLWLDVKKEHKTSAKKSILSNLETILLRGFKND